MIKKLLLLVFIANILNASDGYKIILGTYNSQKNADKALINIQKSLETNELFLDAQKKFKLQLVAMPSDEFFIPMIKPFPSQSSALSLLEEIKKTHSDAFINAMTSKAEVEKTPYTVREKVNVNFADLEISDFIQLISKITNKNILIHDKISGKVDFVSNSPVYADELMEILISVLESKGFTLMENGSLMEVVRSTEAAQHNAKVQSQGKKASGSLMITQSMKIDGENVDVVAAKIRYLISKTAKLMTMKESNTLLITDYPSNIETIKQVIDDLVANDDAVVKIIYVKNTEVKKLQARLVDISNSLFNAAVESEKVKIIYDDNINGIIVVGNNTNVKKIQNLISKLDVESAVNKTVNIFPLKNSDAKSVLTTLTDIVAKQTFTDPALKPNITASEEINAIIAIGDPFIIKGIKHIVDELDKEKYQVYVTARIINIFKKDTEELGIKYGFDGAAVSSSGGLYQLSTNFGGSSVNPALITAAGITVPSALTAGFGLHAAIDFLEKNDASKSISNPSILCVNNKESSIYVGQTISISSGSVSTGGLTGVTNSFKREDVGLTLKIKPRVSSRDKVTLEVETILESIDSLGNSTTGEQPVTSKQEVKTQVILRHAESVIIGGLVKNTSVDNVSKVPLLGDIPYLGALFRSTSTDDQETNLVVVLTPYVIDKSENLSELQKQLGYVAKLQKEYNIEVFKNLEEKDKSATSLPATFENTNDFGE